MAADGFGDMVKAVVDIDRELIAMDAEHHSDNNSYTTLPGKQEPRRLLHESF